MNVSPTTHLSIDHTNQLNAQAAQLRERLMNGNSPLEYWTRINRVSLNLVPRGLVDVRRFAPDMRLLDAPRWSSAQQRFCVRPEIASRLHLASRLLPAKYSLGFWEGYRPLKVQRILWDTGLVLLRETHFHLAEAELEELLDTFIARPTVHAPHTRGNAVDVALVDAQGVVRSTPDALELLSNVLLEAGLSNYEPEWWHWSYAANETEFVQ